MDIFRFSINLWLSERLNFFTWFYLKKKNEINKLRERTTHKKRNDNFVDVLIFIGVTRWMFVFRFAFSAPIEEQKNSNRRNCFATLKLNSSSQAICNRLFNDLCPEFNDSNLTFIENRTKISFLFKNWIKFQLKMNEFLF